MSRSKSVIWQCFTENAVVKNRAKCTLCNENVSRGGDKSANFTTTNLWQHLERSHKSEYDDLKAQQAANMTKALDMADVSNIGCFVHSMQLCITKPLESKERNLKFLSHLLSQCRFIVGHFSHSVLAKERLTKIQECIADHPKRKLVQDVPTRWNSTYYMVERLVEQEKAIVSYDHKYGFPGTVKVPEKYKFGWLREFVELLGPLEAATREMCRDTATAADVIPMVTALKMQLIKPTGSNMAVLKNAILDQIGMIACISGLKFNKKPV